MRACANRVCLWCLALLCLMAAPARGQTLLEPVMVPEAIDAFAETLELTEDQRAGFEELVEAAEAERLRVESQLLVRLNELGERESSVHPMATDEMKEWMIERMDAGLKQYDARAALYENARLLLDEGQLPRLESASMRADRLVIVRSAWGSQISGFSADPLTVDAELGVRDLLTPEETQRYDEAMAGYDRAIAQRVEHFRTVQRELIELIREMDSIMAMQTDVRFLEYMGEFMDDLFDTRRVHQSRATAIATTLPPELRELWEDEWQRQAYPAIHTPSLGERTIEAARAIDVLNDDERAAVERIALRTAREMRSIRRDWSKALQEAEESMTVEEGMSAQQPASDDTVKHSLRAREASEAADRAVRKAVREELHVLLPEIPEEAEAAGAPAR